MKLSTKKRFAAVKRAKQETGGGRVDPSLELTAFEERVAGLIGSPSILGISGGGDTHALQTSHGSGKKGLCNYLKNIYLQLPCYKVMAQIIS